jgi:hypothetical protein
MSTDAVGIHYIAPELSQRNCLVSQHLRLRRRSSPDRRRRRVSGLSGVLERIGGKIELADGMETYRSRFFCFEAIMKGSGSLVSSGSRYRHNNPERFDLAGLTTRVARVDRSSRCQGL